MDLLLFGFIYLDLLLFGFIYLGSLLTDSLAILYSRISAISSLRANASKKSVAK